MELSEINTVEDIAKWIHDELTEWVAAFDGLDAATFQYMGVNLDLLVKELISKASSKEEFVKDMSTLIFIVQLRGVNDKKIKSRMGEEGKKRFDEITGRYGIVAHKRELKSQTPSIPRIMSLFPELIKSVRKKHSKIFGPPLGKVPDGLDQSLCFPGGCALIKESNTDLTDKWVMWYESFYVAVRMSPMPNREQMLIAQRLSRLNKA